MKHSGKTYLALFLLLFIAFGSVAMAQDPTSLESPQQVEEITQPPLVSKVAIIAGLALAPFAIMMLTSFLKLVVVLSLLRQAIGVQNSPPNQAINGMALLMTIYVMYPTGVAMFNSANTYIEQHPQKAKAEFMSNANAEFLIGVAESTREPLKKFLVNNSIQKHQMYFYQLAKQKFPKDFQAKLKPNDLIVLIPAFMTSQVKGAFEMGVLIYLPFFVIDLVTSNILLAMGMMMLSPLTIALPLKLLLLVMIDGWTVIIQGIVLSYR